MKTYAYSLSIDFSGNIDTNQLDFEITQTSITAVFDGINQNSGTIDIVFDSSLTVSHKTELDNVVASHSPFNALSSKTTELHPFNEAIDTTTYINQGISYFPGSKSQLPTAIQSLSKLTSGTTYYVRVFDKSHARIIAEAALNNTDEEFCDLGEIGGFCQMKAEWELQTKVAPGSTAIIKNLSIFYE